MAKKGAFADVDDDDNKPAPEVGPEPDTDKGPVVDLSEPDDAEEPGDATPPGRQKRQDRYWMNKQQREDLERRAADAERRAELAVQQAQLIAQQAQQLSQPRDQVAPAEDPDVGRLKERRQLLNDKYELLVQTNRLTADAKRSMEKEAMDIDEAIIDAKTEAKLRKLTANQAPASNPQTAMVQAHISMNHPDIHQELFKNPQMREYADAVHRQLVATGHSQWSTQTVDMVMERTAQQFRLGKHGRTAPREPSPTLRDRLSGVPRGSSGGYVEPSNSVQLTKAQKKAADLAFPHIPEKGRYKHWLKVTSDD